MHSQQAFRESGYTRSYHVYYCNNCLQVLLIEKEKPINQHKMETLSRQACPGCRLSLSESLSVRSANSSSKITSWKNPQINLQTVKQLYKTKFIRASSTHGLFSKITFIDNLIGGLRSDSVALITGTTIPHLLAERYSVSVQLPESLGGLSSSALFIDGGNSFDVYLFTSIAREYGIDYQKALENITISRAFTPYELLQLIRHTIDEVFEDHQPEVLVISSIFSLFTEDFEEEESSRMIRELVEGIIRVSKMRQIPIIITSTCNEYHEFLFRNYCNIRVHFQEEKYCIRSVLSRHPSKKRTEVIQPISFQTYNQSTLLPLEAVVHG